MDRVLLVKGMGVVAGVAWIACTGFGFVTLLNHTYSPGARGSAPALESVTSGTSLLVFVHPQCPCFRVTMDNLEELLHGAPKNVSLKLYFTRPKGRSDAWVKQKYWKRASQLPHAQLFIDEGSSLAKDKGALTSGHVLLYTSTGRLAFSGGITDGRGHEGRSAQATALRERIEGKSDSLVQPPVFGCPLS